MKRGENFYIMQIVAPFSMLVSNKNHKIALSERRTIACVGKMWGKY